MRVFFLVLSALFAIAAILPTGSPNGWAFDVLIQGSTIGYAYLAGRSN